MRCFWVCPNVWPPTQAHQRTGQGQALTRSRAARCRCGLTLAFERIPCTSPSVERPLLTTSASEPARLPITEPGRARSGAEFRHSPGATAGFARRGRTVARTATCAGHPSRPSPPWRPGESSIDTAARVPSAAASRQTVSRFELVSACSMSMLSPFDRRSSRTLRARASNGRASWWVARHSQSSGSRGSRDAGVAGPRERGPGPTEAAKRRSWRARARAIRERQRPSRPSVGRDRHEVELARAMQGSWLALAWARGR